LREILQAEVQSKSAELRIKQVEERLAKYRNQAAGLARSNKPVPADLQQDITSAESEIQHLKDTVQQKNKDKSTHRVVNLAEHLDGLLETYFNLHKICLYNKKNITDEHGNQILHLNSEETHYNKYSVILENIIEASFALRISIQRNYLLPRKRSLS